jgi:hypothetical protein
MMLYMALLVFLLLVVLYQVYRMTEYFTSSQTGNQVQTKILPIFTPTENTKVSEGIAFLDSIIPIITSLQARVAALPSVVTDVSMTDDEIKAFQYIRTPEKKIQLPIMSSSETPTYFDTTTAKDLITKRLTNDLMQVRELRTLITSGINSNTFKVTDTIVKAASQMYPGEPMMPQMLLNMFSPIYLQLNTVYNYIDNFVIMNRVESSVQTAAATTGTATATTGTTGTSRKITTTEAPKDTTTKANSVHNIKMGSMLSAIGPIRSSASAKGHETTDQTSTVPDSTPSQITEVSLTEETENRLVSSIMKQIKDQRLVDRSLDMPHDSSFSEEKPECSSTFTEQGSEWKDAKPDMSKYIRKDSIPCWNCSP